MLILQGSQPVLICYYMQTKAIQQDEQIGAIRFVTASFPQQHHRRAFTSELTCTCVNALSCALHVFVHVPLSTRRWLPNKPRAIVALDGSA
jgi:hypothetical protein